MAGGSMEKLSNLDLTEGTPWKRLLLFSLPIFLGNIIQQIYSVVDGIIVGRMIGEAAFAAIGLTGNITYIATALASGLPSGTSGLTAQYYGAKEMDKVRKSYAATLMICLVSGLVLTLLMILLTSPLLSIAHLTPGTDTYQYAELYMLIIFGGLLGVFFYNMYLNFLRALGNTFIPFVLLGVYSGLNIAFDALFVIVFHWGVAGAAAAFDLAVLLSAILGVVWTHVKYPSLRLTKADFHFDKAFLSAHLKMGLPMGIEFSIIGIGCLIMQGAVDKFGNDAINGYGAAGRIENFLCTFISALGASVLAFTGQNYGAKKYDRVKEGIKQATVIFLIDALLKILITWAIWDRACDLFLAAPSEATKEYCRQYMIWDFATYLFLGAIYVYRNAELGIGKVVPTFFAGIGELVGRTLMSLAFVIPFGATAALGAPGIAWVCSALICGIALWHDVFSSKAILKSEIPAKSPSNSDSSPKEKV
jgi:putative MATE family efflux protein